MSKGVEVIGQPHQNRVNITHHPRLNLEPPLPATMYLGADVCGYLSGTGTSAKVILMLTDTSVYSGRISLGEEQPVPRPQDLWNVILACPRYTGFLGGDLYCVLYGGLGRFFLSSYMLGLLSHVRGTYMFSASADPHIEPIYLSKKPQKGMRCRCMSQHG